MKILAQRARPHCDCDDLSKTPGMHIDAVVGEPLEILDVDVEPMGVEAEEYQIH